MDQGFSFTKKMKDGDIIVEDGTLAFYAYVLKSGKAKVLKDIEGRLVVIGTLHAGDVFGDMAFLGGEKRTASVIADGNVEVEVIGRDTFMEALEQLPQGVRTKLEAMVSTLNGITEVHSRFRAHLSELQALREKIIDLKSFEREVDEMPELLRAVAVALVHRLNASIEGCTRLAAQAEEAVKPINSLSFSPIHQREVALNDCAEKGRTTKK